MKLSVLTSIVIDRIPSFLAAGASVLIVFLAIGVSLDVVTRYALNRPIEWMFEVSGYCLIGITFLGTAWVLRKGLHVRMDVVANRLKPRVQLYLNMVTSTIGALACLAATWYGVRATWEYYKLGYVSPTTLHLPLTPVVAVIPVAFFLLFIQFLRMICSHREGSQALKSETIANEKTLP